MNGPGTCNGVQCLCSSKHPDLSVMVEKGDENSLLQFDFFHQDEKMFFLDATKICGSATEAVQTGAAGDLQRGHHLLQRHRRLYQPVLQKLPHGGTYT